MRKTIRRRRKEGKTDYKARLALLKSEKPRLIIRKSNRYITAQIAKTEGAQDKILSGKNSKFLLKNGWPKELSGSLKSLAAAYLTGFALGKSAKEKSLILDIGIHRNIPKAKIYAALKGAIDAGLEIPHNPEVFPTDSDLSKNPKTSEIFNKIKQEIAK